MARLKQNPAAVLQQKCALVLAAIKGRASASSSSLSQSYGLPVEDVRRILRSNGVQDDG